MIYDNGYAFVAVLPNGDECEFTTYEEAEEFLRR